MYIDNVETWEKKESVEFLYIQCRPYFCHRSENFYAYFKEQNYYQNNISLNISFLKYNIFRNYFQSINSDFKKYYYFCIKKQLKKMSYFQIIGFP